MMEGKALFTLFLFTIGIPMFIKTWYMDIHDWATNFDLYRGVIVGIIGIFAVCVLSARMFVKLIGEIYDVWQKVKPKTKERKEEIKNSKQVKA